MSSELYPYPVAVSGGAYEQLEATPLPLPPGEPVARVGPGLRFTQAAASSDALTTRITKRVGAYVSSPEELSVRLSEGRELLDACSTWLKEPLRDHEVTVLSKACLQVGGAGGWWYIPGGFHLEDRGSLKDGFAALRSTWARLPTRQWAASKSYYQMTNHGYPDGRTTTSSYIMHMIWAAISLRSGNVQETFRGLGSRLGDIFGRDFPLSGFMFNRSGHSWKWLDDLKITASGPVRVGRLRGMCSRRRQVHGKSTGGNMISAVQTHSLRSAVGSIVLFKHYGHEDVRAKLIEDGWLYFSDDLSAFDQSVCGRHQQEMRDFCVGMGWLTPTTSDFEAYWSNVPVLAPPLTAGAEAFLYTKSAMIDSGKKITSAEGSLINAARIICAAAAAMGVSTTAAAEGLVTGRWRFILQSDDAVVGFRRGVKWDMETYLRVSADLGYQNKVQQGVIMLMRHYDVTSTHSSRLAARIWMQTVLPEFQAASDIEVMLGLASRTEFGDFPRSHPLASHVWRLVRRLPLFTDRGIHSWADLYEQVSTPAFAAELAKVIGSDQGAKRRVRDLVGLNPQLFTDVAPYIASLAIGLHDREPTLDHLLSLVGGGDLTSHLFALAEYLAAPIAQRGEPPSILKQISQEIDDNE